MNIEDIAELQKKEILDFISSHIDEEPSKIVLKYNRKGFPAKAIAEQIHCRKKAQKKFPSLYQCNLIYEKTALEQSSGELTAKFKSELISGEKLIDLTGGLGIDSYFFSKRFKEVTYCEQNEILCEMFKVNSSLLAVKNIHINCCDGMKALESSPDNYFDWIYIDPSRRREGRRFIGLQHYSPDVISNLQLLFDKAPNILIKVSPMFEIEELKKIFRENINSIYVVSVKGECKEILVCLTRDTSIDELKIFSVLLNQNIKPWIFNNDISNTDKSICYNIPPYFYEPDAAIIKAKLVNVVASQFEMYFINDDSEYLTSEESIEDFPGRKFIVMKIIGYNEKDLKNYMTQLGLKKGNVAKRNFPLNVDEIKNKFKIADGGEDYLFFTRDKKNKLIIIHCRRAQG